MDNKKKQNEEKRTPKEILHNGTGSLFTHFGLSFVFLFEISRRLFLSCDGL